VCRLSAVNGVFVHRICFRGRSVCVSRRQRDLCEVQVLDAIGPPDSQLLAGKAIEVRLGSHRSLFVEPGFDTSHIASVGDGAGIGLMIGLPSLRALDGAHGTRIWLAAEAADMRCGFDRLAERVRATIGQDPFSGHYFLFRSRRGDRLKILIWDRDGFVLWYKRLETGVFKLPSWKPGLVPLSCERANLRCFSMGSICRS